eukprot:1144956-Pelagomonas_calceolata.AAC.2
MRHSWLLPASSAQPIGLQHEAQLALALPCSQRRSSMRHSWLQEFPAAQANKPGGAPPYSFRFVWVFTDARWSGRSSHQSFEFEWFLLMQGGLVWIQASLSMLRLSCPRRQALNDINCLKLQCPNVRCSTNMAAAAYTLRYQIGHSICIKDTTHGVQCSASMAAR